MTIKQDSDFRFDGGRSLHLVEFNTGALGDFFITPTTGQDEWRLTLIGDEGTLVIDDGGQTVTRQCATDEQPVVLSIPEVDQAPTGVTVIQHSWNRLIADFVGAIRRGDLAHETVLHLPTLLDGLRTEEVIAAARTADASGQWVTVGA